MKTRFVLAAMACAALAPAAMAADTVQMRFKEVGFGRSVKISVGGGSLRQVFAGELMHEFANGVGLGAKLNGTKATYCTDLGQNVTSSWKTYTLTDVANMPVPAMGNAKANAVADVYNFGVGAAERGQLTNDMSAALQLAIWEVITDFTLAGGRSSLSVVNGDFKAFNTSSQALPVAVLGLVNTIFDYIGEATDHKGILGLAHSSAQDQIVPMPLIPLPGPAAMAIVGLAGLCGSRRRWKV